MKKLPMLESLSFFFFCFQSIYESIRTEPFQFPTDDGEFYNTFFNPDREGWLLKQGNSLLYGIY